MDMARALGDPGGAPDVVKSSLTRADPRFDADTIDTLLGTPQKIHIPERYVPELVSIGRSIDRNQLGVRLGISSLYLYASLIG